MKHTSYEAQCYRHSMQYAGVKKTQTDKSVIYQDKIDEDLRRRLNSLLHSIEKELER